LPSRIDRALERHDPAAWQHTLQYRDRAELPFDVTRIPPPLAVMPDTTVYIDGLKGRLPAIVARLLIDRPILHSAAACAELAISLGHLDPAHGDTARHAEPLLATLRHMPPERVLAPSADAWIEASLMAGTLARIQGYPREQRRKLLHDAILVLAAGEAGAVLISRNQRDMDLLLQLRPSGRVLLYEVA
jgi:predicted nucleic acid-binding protein